MVPVQLTASSVFEDPVPRPHLLFLLICLFRYKAFAKELSRELPGEVDNKQFLYYPGMCHVSRLAAVAKRGLRSTQVCHCCCV